MASLLAYVHTGGRAGDYAKKKAPLIPHPIASFVRRFRAVSMIVQPRQRDIIMSGDAPSAKRARHSAGPAAESITEFSEKMYASIVQLALNALDQVSCH